MSTQEQNILSSPTQNNYADVILPLPVNQAYTYLIPESLIPMSAIGKRALVQFGNKKIYTSIIVNIHNKKPENYIAKEITDILDEKPVISSQQLDLWRWIANYYCCSIGEVMSAALPSALKLESESLIVLNPSADLDNSTLTDHEFLIVEALEIQRELSYKEIRDILGFKNVFNLVKSLYLKGFILPKEDILETYKPKKEKVIQLNPVYSEKQSMQDLFKLLEKTPRQSDLLLGYQSLIKNKQYILKKELLKLTGISTQVLDSMIKKEIFIPSEISISRIDDVLKGKESFELRDFQQAALDNIQQEFTHKDVVLLQGVTNSGKTHIYIKLIESIIQQGRQVLYLVPEIALTAQLIRKLQGSLGNKIGVYHSRLSSNERYEIWYKLLNKEYSAILGVRSALFLPFQDLGMIVVDEEHETSFKQQDPAPRYQARDTAIYLAGLFKAKILLGTATPFFESYYNSQNGKYGYIEITQRYSDVLAPKIIIHNLKEDMKKNKMKGHFSFLLLDEIKNVLERKEQVILFRNRRGYVPFIECQVCGWIPKCKHCDISLTYHKFKKQLSCHYCGYTINLVTVCQSCHSTLLTMKGFGTEKIEDDIRLLFPETSIIRMDIDTTRSKKSFQKMISSFEKGGAQILIGTQMVTKGLDFEKVKLVGVLNADQMLNFPDFRATERSFQLMAQVAGRSGRRTEQGKVIIQTYNPEHYIFNYIIRHDFTGFYEKENQIRHSFNYPPFSKLIMIYIKHRSEATVIECSQYISQKLSAYFGRKILGPESPPVSRIKNEFIRQFIIKLERNSSILTKAKQFLIEEITKTRMESRFKSVKIIIDVDP